MWRGLNLFIGFNPRCILAFTRMLAAIKGFYFMLVVQAYALLQPEFIMEYLLDLDAGFEPHTVQESTDILYMWMGGNEL